MPEFDTTGPIQVTVTLVAGEVRVIAGDQPGTTVEVRPADPSSETDVRFAEQTTVEYANGRLLVKGPKHRVLSLMAPVIGVVGQPGVIAVDITTATGSGVDAEGGILTLTGTGTLGACRVRSGMGDLRLDRVATLDARTGMGALSVRAVDGEASATTGSGELELGTVGGGAQVKNSGGQTRIDSVAGNLRVRASAGGIRIGRAGGDVDAASAMGEVWVGQTAPGTVSLKTAVGEIQVGVPEGLPAYLDVNTAFGTVHNRLTAAGAPAGGGEHVEIRARTSAGDIVIRRP